MIEQTTEIEPFNTPHTSASERRTSVRWRLFKLSAAICLPFLIVIIFLGWRYADAERRVLEAKRFDQANNLSYLMDGEINAVMSVTKVLANMPSIKNGDFAAFREQAEAAKGDYIAVIAVIDETGQQMFSTAVPEGQPLPISSNTAAFSQVFEGKTIVSDVLLGTVVKRPLISVATPVVRDGRVVYTLSAVIYPEKFTDLFLRVEVNPAWASAIVDRNGKFVTRNLSPEKYIGQTARPELVMVARGIETFGTFNNTTFEGIVTGNSFRKSSYTGWTSVVSIPHGVLFAPLYQIFAWALAFALVISIGGILLAAAMAQRIAVNIQKFGEAAGDLIKGNPVPVMTPYVRELSDVQLAFQHALTVSKAKIKAEENVQFLLEELSHRAKNLLAVVQAIANNSARSASSLNDFLISFRERLQALANSQNLLLKEGGEYARLDELVLETTAPFKQSGNRIKVYCDEIFLKREIVQSIGMALHELATNAVKYGALAGPAGEVAVACFIESNEPDSPLRLAWIESGGLPVKAPERKGFGTTVIERMVAETVDGNAELLYDPDGFKWNLTISAKHFEIAPKNRARQA